MYGLELDFTAVSWSKLRGPETCSWSPANCECVGSREPQHVVGWEHSQGPAWGAHTVLTFLFQDRA